jgi:predicted transcriptional regulator
LPRKSSSIPTDAELRLLRVLWNKGRASVADIVEAIPPPPVHYSTVLTTMRIMEKKGFVEHSEEGRTFIYRPLVREDDVATDAVGSIVRRYFGNSTGSLALKLVAQEKPSKEELLRLKALIDQYAEDES